MALRRRVPIKNGQSVLVLGATGNAGTMAVQVAKRLGAWRVVGAGRDIDRLQALTTVGADDLVQLTEDSDTTAALAEAAAEVDIVIDYLWGKPAEQAIMALLTARSDRSRELNWVEIGAMASPKLELPSIALRAANLRIQGNGQGAASTKGYLAELPSLIDEIDSGLLKVAARTAPSGASSPSGSSPTCPVNQPS
jgi:NADPH:quinone reductase-like Zn-dependent oxidoreductase